VLQLIETLRPVARQLNSEDELLYLKEILRRGTSATRQRVVYCQTGSLAAVVNVLVREL
jgi:gamma-glutamyl:cysteine ligase YbdK (ATP-grasp superfamily)